MKQLTNKYIWFFLMLFSIGINNQANSIGFSVSNPGQYTENPVAKYFVATIISRGGGTPSRCTAVFLSPRILLTAQHCVLSFSRGVMDVALYTEPTDDIFRFYNSNEVFRRNGEQLLNNEYEMIDFNEENIIFIGTHIDLALIILPKVPKIFSKTNSNKLKIPFPKLMNAHEYFRVHGMIPKGGRIEFPDTVFAVGYGYGSQNSLFSPPDTQIGFNRWTTINANTDELSEIFLHDVNTNVTYDDPSKTYDHIFTISIDHSSLDRGDSGGPLMMRNQSNQYFILGIYSGSYSARYRTLSCCGIDRYYRSRGVSYATYFDQNDIQFITAIIKQSK